MGDKVFGFERLEVWQDAKGLAVSINGLVETFSKQIQFGLGLQMQRSSVSVASNIAEGTSRNSYKDQAHFTQIAYGSLMELICQLAISYESKYIKKEKYLEFRDQIDKISNKLSALRKYQLQHVNC